MGGGGAYTYMLGLKDVLSRGVARAFICRSTGHVQLMQLRGTCSAVRAAVSKFQMWAMIQQIKGTRPILIFCILQRRCMLTIAAAAAGVVVLLPFASATATAVFFLTWVENAFRGEPGLLLLLKVSLLLITCNFRTVILSLLLRLMLLLVLCCCCSNVLPLDVDLATDYFSNSSRSALRAIFSAWTLEQCKEW